MFKIFLNPIGQVWDRRVLVSVYCKITALICLCITEEVFRVPLRKRPIPVPLGR